MADVCISYAREDRELVLRIVDALKLRGKEVWFDEKGIEPSDEWWEAVKEAIDAADAVVFIISRDWIESETCLAELTHATDANKRLLPVKIGDVADGAVPDSLRRLDWILLGPADDFDHGVEELVRAIELDLEFVRIHTRVLNRARAWELAGRRPTPLLRGEELRQAEAWRDRAATGVKPQPNELQAEFIRESRRRATRRQWIALTTTLGVAVLATGLAIFAFVERHQAQVQRDVAVSRELASEALVRLSSDPQAAVALAAQAVETSPTPQAAQALSTTLAGDDLRLQIRSGVPGASMLALDPGGTLLAVGGLKVRSAGGRVAIVNLDTGRSLLAATDFASNVGSLSFEPGGRELVATSGTQGVVIDAQTGAALQRFTLPEDAAQVQVIDDQLLLLDVNGTVERWDRATGAPLGGPLATDAVAISVLPGGRAVVVAPGGIGVFNALTGALLLPVFAEGHQPIGSAAVSPDGRLVVLSRRSSTGIPVEVWDLQTGRPAQLPSDWSPTLTPQLHNFNSPYGTPVAISPPVSVSPGGRVIVLAQAGTGSITVDGSPGTPARQLNVSPFQQDFTPGGTLLATVDGFALRVYSVLTGTQVESTPSDAQAMLIAHGIAITADNQSGVIDGWRLVPGGAVGPLFGNDDYLDEAITPDGRSVLLASTTSASLYDTETGQPIGAPLVGQSVPSASGVGSITTAALSPSGDYAVVGNAGEALVFDTQTHALIGHVPAPDIQAASFSADGRLLLVAGTGGARVWNWRTGAPVGPNVPDTSQSGGLAGATLSPDGSRLAALDGAGRIQVWDLDTGKPLGPPLRAPDGAAIDPASLQFSPSGTHLLAISDAADVWAIGSVAPVLQIPANTAAAYSPDGSAIATIIQDSAGNRTVRLWQASDGHPLTGDLQDGDEIGHTLSFSGDGNYLAAGPTIWQVPEGVLVETLTGDYDGFQDVQFAGDTRDLLAVSSFESGLEGVAMHTCDLCLPLPQLLALARRPVPGHL